MSNHRTYGSFHDPVASAAAAENAIAGKRPITSSQLARSLFLLVAIVLLLLLLSCTTLLQRKESSPLLTSRAEYVDSLRLRSTKNATVLSSVKSTSTVRLNSSREEWKKNDDNNRAKNISCWSCLYGGLAECISCVPVCTSKLCLEFPKEAPMCRFCFQCEGGCSNCFPCYLTKTQHSGPSAIRSVETPAIKEIRGFHNTMSDVVMFLGIPYAEPPVGERRFQPSVPLRDLEESLDATAFGPVCIQRKKYIASNFYGGMSEDCLFLNVYTPPSVLERDNHHQNNNAHQSPLPVLFWIHGGGFLAGHGSSSMYDPQDMVSRRNVVVVTINYRLGALGFLQHEELVEEGLAAGGMNGVYDQIIALQWVKRNIHAFGGDPNNIQIFGESAGGLSVCALLLSPLAHHLFTSAVVESGPCAYSLWAPFPYEEGLTAGKLYTELVNVSSLHELRKIPVETLQQVHFPPLTKKYANRAPWFVDHYVLPKDPTELLKEPLMSSPAEITTTTTTTTTTSPPAVIFGYNHYDAAGYYVLLEKGLEYATQGKYVSSLGALPASITDYETGYWYHSIASWVGDEAASVAVHTHYPLSRFHNNPAEAAATMNADFVIRCPSQTIASLLTQRGHNVWVYDFYGIHGAEISFLFNTRGSEFTASRVAGQISSSLQQWWTNLARDGNPGRDWPVWSSEEPQLMDIIIAQASAATKEASGPIHVSAADSDHTCEFWEALLPRNAMDAQSKHG